MFFSTTLLDDILEIRRNNTWKSYFLGVFSYLINLPLNLYYLLRLQIYLYLIQQPKHKKKLEKLQQDLDKNKKTLNQDNLRILDWNIQYGNSLLKFNTLTESIQFMNSQSLDVCLLQEVLENDIVNQTEIIKSKLAMKYHLFHHIIKIEDLKIGNLILSQYPLTLLINRKHYQIVKITVGSKRKEIFLINVHFNSDLLCWKQKKLLEEIQKEVEYICNTGQDCKIIMAGDFNLLSWSQYIKNINRIIPMITQNEYTFPSNYPLVKYDYAFQLGLNNKISIEIPQVKSSDHLPILLEISLD